MAVVAAVAVVGTGCGAGDDDGAGGAEDEWEHPDGAQVVIQIRQEGGLRPAGEAFGDVPQATLLGDGRLVYEGAQIAIYPPPALPPLFVRDVGDDGVARALQTAEDAGLLEPSLEFGRPPVADATTTVIAIDVGGRSYRHEIYALSPGPGEPDQLTLEHAARRASASRLVALLTTPEIGVDVGAEPTTYEPEAIAIRATPVEQGQADQPVDGVVPDVQPWPLADVGLAAASECRAVLGENAEELLATLRTSTTITRFEQDGSRFTLQVRPLLPDEDGCGDLA